MIEQLKQLFSLAIGKLQEAIKTTNPNIIRSATIDCIIKGTQLHYILSNGSCNKDTAMNFLSGNLPSFALSQLSPNELFNNIQLGFNLGMQNNVYAPNTNQNFYQQPMMTNNMGSIYQMPQQPVQQHIQPNVFQNTGVNMYQTQSPVSSGVCSKYEDDDNVVKITKPVFENTMANKKVVENNNNKNDGDRIINGEEVLVSEGTYVKNNDYCGESTDTKNYDLEYKKEEITFDELLDSTFLLDHRLVLYTALKYENVKVNMSYFINKNHYELKRVHNNLNTYLLKYIQVGTYNVIDDEEEIVERIKGIESKKVRNSLMEILRTNVENIQCLNVNTKGKGLINKLEYTSVENIVVFSNGSLFNILDKYNVNKVLMLDSDGYENLYNLISKNLDSNFLLCDLTGKIIEFTAARDLINDQRLIINITNKRSIL